MVKINYMSTLFIGIDVSSKSNVVCAMDFDENRYISSSFKNNQPGADELAGMIASCMAHHKNLNTYDCFSNKELVYKNCLTGGGRPCRLPYIRQSQCIDYGLLFVYTKDRYNVASAGPAAGHGLNQVRRYRHEG